jgi:hypothetical protein
MVGLLIDAGCKPANIPLHIPIDDNPGLNAMADLMRSMRMSRAKYVLPYRKTNVHEFVESSGAVSNVEEMQRVRSRT